MSQQIRKIEQIIDSYDGFIIDQWGVLHNGIDAFETALNALRLIKSTNKKAVILSNSGKRMDYNKRRMAEMGFTPNIYETIVTSGEACFQALKALNKSTNNNDRQKAFIVSRNNDRSIVDGLAIDVVATPDEADFMVLAGSTVSRGEPSELFPDLEHAAKLGLLCYCANPDIFAIIGQDRYYTAGFLAHKYEQMGGKVQYFGKPYQPVYDHCYNFLAGIDKKRILAIGDSLAHDIKGGKDFGADTCFISNGVHHSDIQEMGLDKLYEKYDIRPDYVMDDFA